MRLTFEQFLQDKFIELHPECLDDEGPDRFEHFISNLDTSEVIEYAEEYGSYIFQEKIEQDIKQAQKENSELDKYIYENYNLEKEYDLKQTMLQTLI